MISTLIYLLIFIQFSSELNNGLGVTPQMGKIEISQFSYALHEYNDSLKDGIVGIMFIIISLKQ